MRSREFEMGGEKPVNLLLVYFIIIIIIIISEESHCIDHGFNLNNLAYLSLSFNSR